MGPVYGADGAVPLVLSSLWVVRVNDQLKQVVRIAWALFGNQFLSLVEGLYVESFIRNSEEPHCKVTPTHIEPDTTHEVTQRISRNLLRMDVLTSETC